MRTMLSMLSMLTASLAIAACTDARPDPVSPSTRTGAATPPAPAAPPASTSSRRGLVCSDGHWCWEHPSPQGRELRAVWGSAPDDVWAVGAYGTALRWNGARWSRHETPAPAELRAVWGSASDAVWAVGANTLLAWNGERWRSVGFPTRGASPVLTAIAGSARDDVWAVGRAGFAVHWNGTEWAFVSVVDPRDGPGRPDPGVLSEACDGIDMCAGDLIAVWSGGTNDAWIAVEGAGMLHWNGDRWRRFDVPGEVSRGGMVPHALWAAAPDAIWGITETAVLRYDGSSWSAVPAIGPASDNLRFDRIWGSSDRDVWIAGRERHHDPVMFHWDGAAWSRAALAPARNLTHAGVLGWAAADAWLVGAYGSVFRWTGRQWDAVVPPATAITPGGPRSQPVVIGGSSPGGSGPADVWVVANRMGIIVRDPAGTWQNLPIEGEVVGSPQLSFPRDTWGAAADDVWIVESAGVARWNGKKLAWIVRDPRSPYRGVGGSGADDVWLVGDGGVIQRWNGTVLEQVPSGTKADLQRVRSRARDDAWAVGSGGAVLHWDGARWSAAGPPTDGDLTGVYVAPDRTAGPSRSIDGDVWIVGKAGLIARRQAGRWHAIELETWRDFTAIAGSSSTDVWVLAGLPYVDEDSLLLYWNGERWLRSRPNGLPALTALWAFDAGHVWAAGPGGAILRYVGD